MLPIGGLLIAIFVSWVMRDSDVAQEVRMESPVLYKLWLLVLRFIAPAAILVVLVNGLL